MWWKTMMDNKNIKTTYYASLSERKVQEMDFLQIVETANYLNKEIYLDSLTPAIADKINKIIHFWNDVDEDEYPIISERKPIRIYINSQGGSLNAALTIVDAIKISKTPVHVINIGMTYKESFYVYLAGHRKYAYPRAVFYYEKNQEQFDITDGQTNYADFAEKQNQELKDMLLEGTKITESDYEKKKGIWMSAERAYELKICNEVLRTKMV